MDKKKRGYNKKNIYKVIKKKQQDKKISRENKLKVYHQEIENLNQRIKDEAPLKGSNPLSNKLSKTSIENTFSTLKFKDLPISSQTQQGLESGKFESMTDIQSASIPHSLCGRDILGAAKTGSGKTLAFIIPMLELLYRNSWNIEDGVGAIILSPTRELAIQIFDVLRIAGKFHDFSAGLVIGGKNVDSEKKMINNMNILIATPGRLLQHMDETTGFNCSNLQMLILDEADRILDLGFSKSLNAIVQNLPSSRQTLLFSATQTKSIKDLARLSLRDPEYISVYDQDLMSTPHADRLAQTVVISPLEDKINLLYSFVHSHLTKKTIVFLTTCKQVRFIYETFHLINPGCRLFQLHGKMKQHTRLDVFQQFCDEKMGTLFATDIAARGLDFPAVDWVVQLDCPEDIQTYIHRVGRTARNNTRGNSLTVLLPSEKSFLEQLENQGIEHQVLDANPTKSINIHSQLSSILSEKVELKYLAQKSFATYIKSIYRQDNKKVFSLEDLDLNAYSKSLGLPGAPNVKVGKALKTDKNNSYALNEIKQKEYKKKLEKEKEKEEKQDDDDDDEEEEEIDEKEEQLKEIDEIDKEEKIKEEKKTARKNLSKVERLFTRKNSNILSKEYNQFREDGDQDDQDDDMFVMKRKDHSLEDVKQEIQDNDKTSELSQRQQNRLVKVQRRIVNPDLISHKNLEESTTVPEDGDLPQQYLANLKSKMEEVDPEDKEVHRQKLRERRARKALKTKEVQNEQNVAYFVPPEEGQDQSDIEQDSDIDQNSDSDQESYQNSDDNQDSDNDSDQESYQESDHESDDDDSSRSKRSKNQIIGKKRNIDDQEDMALQILLKRNRK